MNPTLIHHFLENSTRRFPDKVALVFEEVRATYRQINALANSLARFLVVHGVNPGDRVVFLLENSLEYAVAYYGALKAGAVAVPMNTELKGESLVPLLQELEAKCLLTAGRFERLLRTLELGGSGLERVVVKDPKLDLRQPLPVVNWDEVVTDAESDNLVSAKAGAAAADKGSEPGLLLF